MPCKCSVFPQDAFPLSHLPSALSPHTVAQRFIQGHMLDSDVMNLKVQLRNRLNSCRLSNMPGGFPFHHVFDGHGSAHLSSDSYEFREEFRTSTFDQLPRYQKATISFTSPNSTRNKRNYLSWRAFLPTLDPSYCRGACDKIAVADVQVEPAVMNTPYGNCIKMDPFVILRALAISLELGIIVTIKFWDATVPSPRGYRNAQWRPGTIVYVGTHEDGRQETLFIANQ
ncbi:hypothetical protein L208DRAFT_1417042 [Tricholoma matsutake]|nr:hypothetical protein L208DRAFT_1417042 [Tricholoma matsutake 945]